MPQCNYGYIQHWTTKYLRHKEAEIPIMNVYSTTWKFEAFSRGRHWKILN